MEIAEYERLIKKSIVTKNYYRCYVCGSEQIAQIHHCIFGRGYRALSDKYGLIVPICNRCHDRLHIGEQNLAKSLQKDAQVAFEKKYSHEFFMEVFGRNNL